MNFVYLHYIKYITIIRSNNIILQRNNNLLQDIFKIVPIPLYGQSSLIIYLKSHNVSNEL